MTNNWRKTDRCCICGESFALESSDIDAKRTRAHIPPLQFYPKSVRDGKNLWCAAAHKKCNNSIKDDEEYFYTRLYPLVAKANPDFAKLYLDDLKRRAAKPQTQHLMQEVLDDASTITPGGVHLPPNIVQWNSEEFRIQQVAISIAQGLSYFHDNQYLPSVSCIDIRLCETPNEVPELYQLVAANTEELAVDSKVFSCHRFRMPTEDTKLFTLLFWESFMFCLAFRPE